MHQRVLRALLAGTCAWLGACGSTSETPARAPTIDDGVRLTYSLGEGSPDAAAQVMRRRLALARIKGWASAQGDAIVVDLAGSDPEAIAAARDLIARTANFQVRLVVDDEPVMRRLAQGARDDASAQAAGIGVDVDQWQAPDGERHVDAYLRAPDREEAVDLETARRIGCFRGGPVDADQRVRCRVTGRSALERHLRAAAQLDPSLALPDDHQVAFEHVAPDDRDGLDRRPYWRTYAVVRAPKLSSQAVADARPMVDQVTERPIIRLTLRADAATAFAELTRANVGKKLALILDDRVVSAPVVNGPVTGGQLTLHLAADADQRDARQLAIALSSGPLPGPVRLETEATLEDGKVIFPPID